MSPRVLLVGLIALASVLLAACERSASISAASAATPTAPAPTPIEPAGPRVTRTPSGIFVSTSVPVTEASATTPATANTPTPASTALIVQGRVYDAGSGQRLSSATVEWQFLAVDWQQHNGQVQVPADGLYRLELPARQADEVIITAHAPGYLSSMARLLGKQLNPYGSRLNFGLVKSGGGPAPTLPGALGMIQLSGIVYNSAHGLKDPIADARVIIVNHSVVQPMTKIEAATSVTGTFVAPLALHTTDQIEVTISASGYQTTTLTRSAKDLAKKPQWSIGLKPVPKQ
jgi:hypothetical protein